jgi:iron complex outermembrane receptor protein
MSDSKEYSANTYTASLEYQWTDQTLVYLAHRKGYKSGGYSLRIHARPKFAYAPEFATDYEAGIKSDWKLWDMPVRTNLAVYRTKLTDMQVQVSNANTTPVSTYTDNVGKGRVSGYEFEFSLLPTERWEVSGFVSYTNPKVEEYKAPIPGGFLDLSWRNVIGNGMPSGRVA